MPYTAAVNVMLQCRPVGEVIHCSIWGPSPPDRQLSKSRLGASSGTPSYRLPVRQASPATVPRVPETGARWAAVTTYCKVF